jgi:hypothetical protein
MYLMPARFLTNHVKIYLLQTIIVLLVLARKILVELVEININTLFVLHVLNHNNILAIITHRCKVTIIKIVYAFVVKSYSAIIHKPIVANNIVNLTKKSGTKI